MPFNLRKMRAQAAVAEKQKHYERMLRDIAGEGKLDPETEEGLLEKQRVNKDPEGITEALLEKVRKSTTDVVTEKRLDTEKPSYGCVNRCDALDGSQVPPLEKKRQASKDVMEKEKYEKANEKTKKTK